MSERHTPLRLAFARPWPGTLRGLILWLFGIAFIVVGGLNYIGTTIPEPTRTYLQLALAVAPPWVFGVVFIAVGALAMLSSYCHYGRGRHGFVLASTFSALWASVYVSGWLFADSPIRALGGAVVWVLYAAILTVCARIPKIPFDFAARA